jgi:3-hydroxyacyl-[acyl-carrier-protein] dehydratase
MTENDSLRDELKRCLLSAHAAVPGEATLTFSYPESFTGFQGHFPGDPILPGVCVLQSLRIGLEQAWRAPLRLVEIIDARFLSPTKPGDELLFNARESARDGGVFSVKTKVTRKGARVAELTVKLEQTPAP